MHKTLHSSKRYCECSSHQQENRKNEENMATRKVVKLKNKSSRAARLLLSQSFWWEHEEHSVQILAAASQFDKNWSSARQCQEATIEAWTKSDSRRRLHSYVPQYRLYRKGATSARARGDVRGEGVRQQTVRGSAEVDRNLQGARWTLRPARFP